MFKSEALTQFETNLIDSFPPGAILPPGKLLPAYGNSRGYRIVSGPAAVIDADIIGRKYGVSVSASPATLIKNLRFRNRQSTDMYGAGIFIENKPQITGPVYISNAWIDLMHPEPIADYRIANNEAICAEAGAHPIWIRRATLLNAEDAAIDTKSPMNIDAAFMASGHRCLRIWDTEVVIANSILLAHPGCKLLWTTGAASLKYYDCRFGIIGDSFDQLSTELPSELCTSDDGTLTITELTSDPFTRGAADFFTPADLMIAPGFLTDPNAKRDRETGRMARELVRRLIA